MAEIRFKRKGFEAPGEKIFLETNRSGDDLHSGCVLVLRLAGAQLRQAFE